MAAIILTWLQMLARANNSWLLHPAPFFRSVSRPRFSSHVLLSLTSCLRIVISIATAIGSILEVPAESCSGVKASEEGCDGKYWLSSIIPGTLVFAYCDMKAGG